MVMLKSMSLHRNMQPAGNTLQVNDSFPIKESNTRFVQLRRVSEIKIKACFRSCVMLASIVVVFNRMPKNVSDVDGPTSLVH